MLTSVLFSMGLIALATLLRTVLPLKCPVRSPSGPPPSQRFVRVGHTMALLLGWGQGLKSLSQGLGYLQRLHQIPCSRCVYFTGDYRLKCTVDPMAALTEAAIGCPDYQPTEKKNTLVMGCGGCDRKKRVLHPSKVLLKR